MRTLPCITFRILLDQRPGAGIASWVGLLGDHGAMDVLSSRVLLQPTDPERSRCSTATRWAGDLPGVRQRYGPGHGLLPGRRVPGAVGPRCRATGIGHGVVAAGARAGPGATGARRAWRADPAGAQAGAVGAAGDVDCGPRGGAHLHCGGAGG